jgi:hypothetical protein
MSVSRRKFLRAGTLVAITAGFPLKSLVAKTLRQPNSFLPTNSPRNTGLQLNREIFSRHLNTEFSFSHHAVGVGTVKLIEVNSFAQKTTLKAADGKECFALVFTGSRSAPLRQETYNVTHESIGKFAMLVVPIGMNNKVVYYEAVFNRLH